MKFQTMWVWAVATVGLAGTARAEALQLDDGLLLEAQTIVAAGTQASSALPALMDLSKVLAGAGKGSNQNNTSSSSSSSSGGANMLSGVGVGLQVGTPTALTFKFAGGGNTNIVLGVGAFLNSASRNAYQVFDGLSLHGDYLFTVGTLVNNGTFDLTAYIGPGLWLYLFASGAPIGYFYGNYFVGNVGIGLGARLPLGLNLRFSGAPIEVYLELDPALFVFPGVALFVGASIGFRWFF